VIVSQVFTRFLVTSTLLTIFLSLCVLLAFIIVTKDELAKITKKFKDLKQHSNNKAGVDAVAFAENWLPDPKKPFPTLLASRVFEVRLQETREQRDKDT
jgi:hypothetical protein